jgi:hypothetical protein
MYNQFAKDQKGGVSPQFAILISAVFISIGCALYFEGETVYRLFDDLMNEVKYAVKL